LIVPYGANTIKGYKQLKYASLDDLKGLVGTNQNQLMRAVEAIKPGEFPKLGFHGTSDAGEKFLWQNKRGASFPSGDDAPLWINTFDKEPVAPQQYLSDIQNAISKSSGLRPGDTDGIDHSMFVVDTSKADSWSWNSVAKQYRQHVYDLDSPQPRFGRHDYIGEPSGNVSRKTIGLTQANFNERVLGSFQNPSRNIPLDIPRNYFDAGKYERNTVIGVFDLQEETAQALDLGGVLARVK
jgi:hypothetical protein